MGKIQHKYRCYKKYQATRKMHLVNAVSCSSAERLVVCDRAKERILQDKELPQLYGSYLSQDHDQQDEDLNCAAVKIQSLYRGYVLRRERDNISQKESSICDLPDLMDKEVQDAAIKNQAGFRSYKVRKNMASAAQVVIVTKKAQSTFTVATKGAKTNVRWPIGNSSESKFNTHKSTIETTRTLPRGETKGQSSLGKPIKTKPNMDANNIRDAA